jgi:uncharacterized damage-inducible protein DinB
MLPRRTLATAAALAALWMPEVSSGQAVTSSLRGLHGMTMTNIMASAEMLDESLYAFRPTEEVRSMGELFAHVASAQFGFCSAAAGESSPQTENYEETRTTKASILDALSSGFAYCDGVYARMTDEMVARGVNFFTGPNTAFGVLAFNSAHNYEHYGNLVTYMRLNGITPPSSMRE